MNGRLPGHHTSNCRFVHAAVHGWRPFADRVRRLEYPEMRDIDAHRVAASTSYWVIAPAGGSVRTRIAGRHRTPGPTGPAIRAAGPATRYLRARLPKPKEQLAMAGPYGLAFRSPRPAASCLNGYRARHDGMFCRNGMYRIGRHAWSGFSGKAGNRRCGTPRNLRVPSWPDFPVTRPPPLHTNAMPRPMSRNP